MERVIAADAAVVQLHAVFGSEVNQLMALGFFVPNYSAVHARYGFRSVLQDESAVGPSTNHNLATAQPDRFAQIVRPAFDPQLVNDSRGRRRAALGRRRRQVRRLFLGKKAMEILSQ